MQPPSQTNPMVFYGCMQFINRTTIKQFGICVCYLPPAGSSRGDQSQEFFDALKALVIDNYHLGEFLICGNFNAWCGTLEDTPNVGEIPSRIPVDEVSNQLGKELIETMCALELCTLNGRFDQSKDNFTSVSCKGLAVVDYFMCPYSFLSLFFQVYDILDIIKSKDSPIDLTIPDHRLLTAEFKQPQRSSKINNTKQQVKVRSIPMGYMQDSVVLEQLCMLADPAETVRTAEIQTQIFGEFYQGYWVCYSATAYISLHIKG